jgi:hypothetical protein
MSEAKKTLRQLISEKKTMHLDMARMYALEAVCGGTSQKQEKEISAKIYNAKAEALDELLNHFPL